MIRERLARLWAHNRLALLVFAGLICVLGFFAVRTVSLTLYWMDPAHQDQALAGWMTPRYVARSYKLPPDVLGPALFLVKDAPPRRIRLETIALENSVTLADLQARIDAAATQWRAERDAKE